MSTVIAPTCEFTTELRKQLSTPQLPPAGNGLPTLDKVEREIANVLERQLSPALAHWVEGYAKVGRRNTYLWKWCRQGVEVTTLPCVLPGLKDQLCDTKVLGVILDVLLDDVADMKGHGDLLEHLLSLLLGQTAADFSSFDPAHQPLARFTIEVWREIQRRAESYPRFDDTDHRVRITIESRDAALVEACAAFLRDALSKYLLRETRG